MGSLYDNFDTNDVVHHPQTGEKYLIPRVCCACGSDDLLSYTVQGDFLPIDGWRVCRDCEGINSPIPDQRLCLTCLGDGLERIAIARAMQSEQSGYCPDCDGTGRRNQTRDPWAVLQRNIHTAAMKVPSALLAEPADKNTAHADPRHRKLDARKG